AEAADGTETAESTQPIVPWGKQDCAPLPVDDEPPSAPLDNVMMVRLSKVVPISERMRSRLECSTLTDRNSATSLARADLWPPVARIDEVLRATIETGESENYYFRALIPCEDGLTLSASVRVPKRSTVTDVLFGQRQEGMVWISQTIFEVGDACAIQ
ncbi:MAG: hypothetical protein LC634_02380, partial [Sphingomonadales bacterium]|nr:hypothetical protein [Sphingomonadales bacterium]